MSKKEEDVSEIFDAALEKFMILEDGEAKRAKSFGDVCKF